MNREDRRTEEQRRTHHLLVVGTDPALSGWGKAEGGASYAAWACTPEDLPACEAYVKSRGDLKRVRVVLDGSYFRYRPKCAHLSIYVYNPEIHK